MALTLTVCPYCGAGCQMYLRVEAGRLVGVSPSLTSPVNRGQLCVKGWHAGEFVHSPERLRTPLIREASGAFRPASWEAALELVARRLSEIKAACGPEALAFFASAKCTNEENFLLMKLARAVFSTNHVDHCARLCHAATVVGLERAFGSGAMTNSLDDLLRAECLLVTGSNTTEQHPIIGGRIIEAVERNHARLILVDPRRLQLSPYAVLHLRQRPGTDVAWLMGLAHLILAGGQADEAFIAARTEGFAEFARATAAYPPEKVEQITGIPQDQLRRAAQIFGEAHRAMILYSMGITQHTSGVNNVLACANLALLTGNLGRAGVGLGPLRGQNNVQGACDMGALPNVYSGYQRVNDAQVRAKFEAAWKVSLPPFPGHTVTTALPAAAEGQIKGLYIMGENPLLSEPDLQQVRRALEKLEFLVVQDIFLTETAALAHVVLPAASFAEKDGTFTNTERRVLPVNKALAPVGEARADWEILSDLARRAGYAGMSYASPAEILREIARLTPAYGGILPERLAQHPEGLQWPCPDAGHPGTPILHRERFAKGRGTFHAVHWHPPAEIPDAVYDLTLTTGRMYFHFHTGTMTRRTSILHREVPEAFVEVNPADAQTRGVRDRDYVQVATRRGRIALRAEVTERVPPGIIFIPFHFREAAANALTNSALDPEAKIPEYKACAARLEKLAGKTDENTAQAASCAVVH